MSGYGQYCPVARGAEVLAERWTPIIIRNLDLGCHSFYEILAGAPGMSKTLLSARLVKLARVGVIEAVANPRGRGSLYYLSEPGHELAEVCKQLGTWAARWTEMELEHMDPFVVLWAKSRLWDLSKLPTARVLIRFAVSDYKRPLWILVQRSGAELCVKHPGFEEDLIVSTDRETLALWHLGRLSYRKACADGLMKIEGQPALVRSFPTWVPLSVFADVKPAKRAALA